MSECKQGMPLMMVLNINAIDAEGNPSGALLKSMQTLKRLLAENLVHYVGKPELLEEADRGETWFRIEVDFDCREAIVRFAELMPGSLFSSFEIRTNYDCHWL